MAAKKPKERYETKRWEAQGSTQQGSAPTGDQELTKQEHADEARPASAEEAEEEAVVQKEPKMKKRIVVVQESNNSDEEIEVRLPRERKQKEALPPSPPSPIDAQYERTFRQLLGLDYYYFAMSSSNTNKARNENYTT